MAEYAEQFGLEIDYHIHMNMLVDSIEDWQLYMGHIDKTKLCIDVSHAQLWGYEPNTAIRNFQSQLNNIHLREWATKLRQDDGFYLPAWCDVGEGGTMDFPAIKDTLYEIGFSCYVTEFPRQPPKNDDPVSAAMRNRSMVEYLRSIGY